MMRTFSIVILIGLVLSLPQFTVAAILQVGYAEVDITPEMGVTMPGYFRERRADGILDPLMVKALVLSQGDTTLAIVAFDLIGIPKDVADEIRRAVEKKTGIPIGHQFIHGTHTHTGATVSEIRDALPGQAAEAVQNAIERLSAENKVTYGVAEEHSAAFIRRYLMKDGTVRTNPGRMNPEIVRPLGKIDPRVHTIAFEDSKTMLVSFGLHLDCIGGTKFSADYPYHLTQTVKESLGEDWNVIYLNACCGNVNHINVNDPHQLKGYEESTRIGRALGRATLEAHRESHLLPVDILQAKVETVDTPVRTVPKELYQWAKMQMDADAEQAAKRQFNERTPSRIVELAERQQKSEPANVSVFRIGPVGLVGLPAEVFVEVARDIQTLSLLDPTLVIGLTNGAMGYVPHRRGYSQGGYEATYASARYAPNTPILWSDTAVKALNDLVMD